MKKLVSLFFCMMILFSLALNVSAEEGQNTETTGETTETSAPTESQHVCSFLDGTVTTEATCTAAGVKTLTCSCGATKTAEIEAKGHSYGNPSKVDDTNHKRICSVCNAEEVSAHSWGEGSVTAAATCQQEGKKTYTCSCGATKEETIAKISHDWNKDSAKHICKNCSSEGSHTLKEEVTQKATCKDAGVKTKTCTVCGYAATEAIPALTTHTYDSACDAECNVCGIKREIEHTFTKVWSKNYKGHWHECTKCGEEADFAKHIPGPAATEEKEQVCLTCSYVLMPKKNHVHSYGDEWTSDSVGHWHACTGCKEEKDYASHAFDDDCDADCNTCGYERQNSHTYDMEGWQVSSFDHWNICSACGEESKREKHVPGAEATENLAQLCTVCGYELAPAVDHNHEFGTVYLSDETSHWQKCECGELSVPVLHSWNSGKENKDDTVTYTCTDCGEEKTVEAPDSGFPWWLTLLLVILALVCIGGIAAIVMILKRGDFDQDEESVEELSDETLDPEVLEQDEEEKMIDDFFASIDEEFFK